MTRVRDAVPRLFATETLLAVRFADVDMMQLVHHSVYLHWFEQIRFHFLENVAHLPLDTLRREGIAFPVVSCAAEYLRPVRFGDSPVGYGRMTFHRKALVSLQYEILAGPGGPVCARGETRHCYVDRNFRLLIAPPPMLLEVFRRAVRECGEAFVFEPPLDRAAEPTGSPAGKVRA